MLCNSDDMMNRLTKNEKNVSYDHAEPAQLLNYMMIQYPQSFEVINIFMFTLQHHAHENEVGDQNHDKKFEQ